jgi:hypothetical protein
VDIEEAPELRDVEQEYTNMTVQDDYKSDEHEYQRAVEGMINEGFHNTDRVRQIHAHPKIKHIFAPDTWTGLRKIEAAHIELIPGAPTHMIDKVRQIPLKLQVPAQNALSENVRDGFMVKDSTTRYASALVVVAKPKTPDKARLCGDFTRINKIIIPRPMAIPDPVLMLDRMKKFKLFIETDWTRSFHQIPITTSTSKLLTITTPYGTFRPQFLPEGVQPASGILADIVREIFDDYSEWCLAIHDNILIGADTEEQLLDRWQQILDRCAEYNVILSPTKTKIGLQQVEWFGYVLGDGQLWASQKRLQAIDAIDFPTTATAMKKFIGLTVFVSPFVDNYAQLSAPLTDLLSHKTDWRQVAKEQYKYMGAFDDLKEGIRKATATHLPDVNLEWVLRTDASDIACGAVLFQINPHNKISVYEPIAFISHKFSKAATRWSVLEKELYGVIFAIKRLDYYIRGKPMVVETDHSNIMYLEKTLIPKLIRWKLLLNSYPLTVRHIPGKLNTVADALSRLDISDESTPELDKLHLCMMELSRAYGPNSMEYMTSVPVFEALCTEAEKQELFNLETNDDLDAAVLPNTAALAALTLDLDTSSSTPVLLSSLPEAEEGAVIAHPVEQEVTLDDIFRQAHVVGKLHKGARKTYKRIVQRYPDIKTSFHSIQQRVDSCPVCQKFRADVGTTIKALRYGIQADTHRSLLCVDVLGMEPDKHGNTVCYVMVNAATKLMHLYPARNKSEIDTVNAILSFIGIYGLMDGILSDPGTEFTASSVQHLFAALGIKWQLGVVNRPQSHGTEPTVKKVIESVRIILAEASTDLAWSDAAVLSTLTFLWNTEVNTETKDTPFNLTFGRGDKDYSRLVCGDLHNATNNAATQRYLDALSKHMDSARRQALKHKQQRQQQRQLAGDIPGDHSYMPGDLVFIKDDSILRARKFLARKQGPYRVLIQQDLGRVQLTDLVDENVTREAHHNSLVLFEGSEEQAKVLARLDREEKLIQEILDHKGSMFAKSYTTYRVRWSSGEETWEPYAVVQPTLQFQTYAEKYPVMTKRLLLTNQEFSIYQREINDMSHSDFKKTYFSPHIVDASTLTTQPAFALDLLYFDRYDVIAQMKVKDDVQGKDKEIYDNMGHPRQLAYFKAYLIKITKKRYDVYVPALSPYSGTTPNVIKHKYAYIRPVSQVDILHFAHPLPLQQHHWEATVELTADLLFQCNLCELIFPDKWLDVPTHIHIPKYPVEQEVESIQERGKDYGRKGFVRYNGRRFEATVEGIFKDGDILVVFESTGHESKIDPTQITFHDNITTLKTRKGLIKSK